MYWSCCQGTVEIWTAAGTARQALGTAWASSFMVSRKEVLVGKEGNWHALQPQSGQPSVPVFYINCLTCVKMSWVTSTLQCLGWHRPDLYYNCGYCATCKWYSVVVWDWKVPQLHVSEHLAPGNSTVGEVVEPKDTGTARGHMSQALWK